MLDGPCTVLDIRPSHEYDEGRITKPPRKAVSVPFAAGQDGAGFVGRVSQQCTNKAASLIVMCADGDRGSAEAADLLQAAGYSAVMQMEGGYAGYSKVWGPSGKRRPPAGRWVSTGKEALKSGLNVPGAADSYDEGGNQKTAKYAEGLPPGQSLLDPLN
ncbi:hypothetical protein D9Q98_004695 [Chlorella vulgaris]|uniref:Rhodanese domain-containing protein n=1 Tax=Chlorella vulgaris TaxID=3077 RepID=A0A9D4TQF5_CHLVU|nr:hypothetical protein D9Q98_004695 [Chlorella vulgaris]